MPFVTVDGARVHYLDEGDGEPVLVLLHAFPLHSAMWEPQVAELSRRCRIVAPDLPGFGQSDPLPDPATASLEAMAEAVAGLLAQLEVPPVVLGGLSLGGYVAFVLARHHRRLIRALVLADTRAGADTDEVRERRTRQQAQVREDGPAEVIETLLGTLLTEKTRTDRADVVERVRGIMADASPDAIVAGLEAMKARSDATGELAGLDVPALVLVGDQDATAPPEVAEEMQRRLPDAQLAVIPEAAHLSNVENPDAFNRELSSFLERIPPAG